MSTIGSVPRLRCPNCGGEHIECDAAARYEQRPDGSWSLPIFCHEAQGSAECRDCGHEDATEHFINHAKATADEEDAA